MDLEAQRLLAAIKKRVYDAVSTDSDSDSNDEAAPVAAPAPAVAPPLVGVPVTLAAPAQSRKTKPKTRGYEWVSTGIFKIHNYFKVQVRSLVTGKRTHVSYKTLAEAYTAYAAERALQTEHKLKQPKYKPTYNKVSAGVYKYDNHYTTFTRSVANGKKTSTTHKTLAAAQTAYAAERARWAAHSHRKAARPLVEKRADSIARNGRGLTTERDFARALTTASNKRGTPHHVMNDSVRADTCLFAYADEPTLAMGVQIKTTRAPHAPGQWVFASVRGYAGMPVVCWCVDKQSGWVFDGKWLDANNSRTATITLKGKYAKNALSGVKPIGIDAIAAFLESVAPEYVPRTKAYMSWEFAGRSHQQVKERIGIHLHKTHFDAGSVFPDAQSSSYDQVAGDGTTRLQFKTACVFYDQPGLSVNLHESAGMVDGKRTYRPYAVGAFDVLIVYFFDWKAGRAHTWRIPASELQKRGYLRTGLHKGKTSVYVYTSTKRKHNTGGPTCAWTVAYYEGTHALTLPPEAEAAAGHLLRNIRAGAA